MPKVTLENYQNRFRSIRIDRDDDGILVARLHTDEGPVLWGVRPHYELTTFWDIVAQDRETKAIVLTGTGDAFINRMEAGKPEWVTPANFAPMISEGRRLLFNPLDVPVPVIAAVNGQATVHSEQALLADVVLASPDACFADLAHLPSGIVPGDGIQAVFQLLFGINRGRYLLYTGESVSAADALACGAIAEIVPKDGLLERAKELARRISKHPAVAVRATRMLLNTPLQKLMLDATTTGAFAEAFAAMDHWPADFATNTPRNNGRPAR